ncbi:hypothetical protein ACHAP5_008203 [Fusarium lateritium]
MGRTDINNRPISCGKCKKGHRDASCNDSHPGPCFYRGTRGRPRRGQVGKARDPIPVPDYLLRPVSGAPVGPSLGPPSLPTPPSQVLRHPHLGDNGGAVFVASPFLHLDALSPDGVNSFGQSVPAPLFPSQIGDNGYDAPMASPNFSSGATSPSASHSSGQSSALVSATSSDTLSSEEALDSETATVPLTWEDFEQWGKDHDDRNSYREGDLEKWCETNFDFN